MTKELDKSLAALFGFLEGVLILSVVVVILDTYFVVGAQNGATLGLGLVSNLTASFNQSYTVHLLRETTVPIVLALLGPLLPKDISTLVPGGLPGMPGIPTIPGLHGLPGLPGILGLPTPAHATPRP